MIARDRESFWQYKVEQEADTRRLWEEIMAKIAKEQEDLEKSIGESEEKRKRTKRALREALEGGIAEGPMATSMEPFPQVQVEGKDVFTPGNEMGPGALPRRKSLAVRDPTRKSTIEAYTELSDSDSDGDEEFFDAVGAGEIPVADTLPESPAPRTMMKGPLDFQSATAPASQFIPEKVAAPVRGVDLDPELHSTEPAVKTATREAVPESSSDLTTSFKGYEDPPRRKLKLDADNRPAISLWVSRKALTGWEILTRTRVSLNP